MFLNQGSFRHRVFSRLFLLSFVEAKSTFDDYYLHSIDFYARPSCIQSNDLLNIVSKYKLNSNTNSLQLFRTALFIGIFLDGLVSVLIFTVWYWFLIILVSLLSGHIFFNSSLLWSTLSNAFFRWMKHI